MSLNREEKIQQLVMQLKKNLKIIYFSAQKYFNDHIM